MLVKASKSKTIVIVSGKIMHDKSLCITVNVNSKAVQSITNNQVRLLERTISDALSDKYKGDSLTLALTKGLVLITMSFIHSSSC